MDLKTYTEKAKRTCSYLGYENHNLHMVLGMGTEVGELQDVFKKNMAYNRPIDWVNVEEEIGDLMWYIANFCRANKLDLNTILEKNIRKLEARYPDKFSNDLANNRDLSKERAILEDLGFGLGLS